MDAAIIPVKYETHGEVPKGFVVEKQESITEIDLQLLVKEQLANYK